MSYVNREVFHFPFPLNHWYLIFKFKGNLLFKLQKTCFGGSNQNMYHPEINVWKYDIRIVCYHEDWCTKNKRMFWIPMRGLFLSSTENSFLFCTHIKNKADAYFKKSILIGKAIPCSPWIPNPFRSLAWSQLSLRCLHFPRPLHPLPSNRAFVLHKDDINKPNTSVGHKNLFYIVRLLLFSATVEIIMSS